MTEILFYHLEQKPLEAVLPVLLEKTLERGWRAMVECANPTRMNALDEALWTFRPDSFLPHMVLSDQIDMDELAEMPVLISDSQENPNNAQIRFYVEGAVPEKADNYERVVFMFNGHDPDAVTRARQAWKALSKEHELTYWQQEQSGRWVKKSLKLGAVILPALNPR